MQEKSTPNEQIRVESKHTAIAAPHLLLQDYGCNDSGLSRSYIMTPSKVFLYSNRIVRKRKSSQWNSRKGEAAVAARASCVFVTLASAASYP